MRKSEIRTIKIQIEIAAEQSRVFQALVSQADLSAWFAQNVSISLENWQYDFWGINTPETPDSEAGQHPLVEFSPNEQIRYAWHLRERDTLVKIRIRESEIGTRLTLIHEYLPLIKKTEYSLSDFWVLSLENLRGWLERGTTSPKYDFAQRGLNHVDQRIQIESPPDQIFQALINPQQLNRYIAKGAVVDPEPGGKYDFGWGEGGPIRILELEENQRLSYSWNLPDEPHTTVIWDISEIEMGSELHIAHTGFEENRPCDDYNMGWAGYLVWIKGLVESGDAWVRPDITAADY